MSSDPLGLAGAGGASGASAALRQIIMDRIAQQMAARQALVQDRDFELRRRQQDFTEQQRADALKETQRQHSLEDENRMLTRATALNDAIPGGREFAPTEPIVGMLRAVGGVKHEAPTMASTQLSGYSSLPEPGKPMTGRLVSADAAAKPERFVKLPSAKQLDTEADNERQTAQLRRQEAADASNADIRGRLADIAGQNADVRARMADVAGQNAELKAAAAQQKAAQGPKLPQREDDTVVSIHQMTPLIDELLSKTQARLATKPKPQTGVMGTLSAIPEKAGRLATKAAYSAGLPVAPADSERIQLASLLEILGTVPYLRGIRNMQFVKQIQQHLSDPTATDESLLERLQTLKRILPGMEQAIYDVHNQGVIPHAHGGTPAPAGNGKPSAADLIKKYGGQ